MTSPIVSLIVLTMFTYSTNEVARRLGITGAALSKYIKAGKVPAPKTVQVGRVKLHSWTESDIERLRKLLPKIKNGRKTRYQKQKSEARSQKSEEEKSKAKQPQAKRPVPHKQSRKEK